MRILTLALGLLLALPAAHADELPLPCDHWRYDSLVCWVEILSWAEVTFDGEAAKRLDKADLERLIRMRVHNDLSFLKHEVADPMEATKRRVQLWHEVQEAPDDRYMETMSEYNAYMKKRAALRCHIWTVGTGYPLAFHVECELDGYSTYDGLWSRRDQTFESLSTAYLAVGSEASLQDQINRIIRKAVASISAKFTAKP